ncbi:MAG: FAD binding domain-containing protein [Pseudomonadota bacterium]
MKPAPFDYYRPDTVADALRTLDELGEGGKVLAGGQSLIAMLNLRIVKPAALVDISQIQEMQSIRDAGDHIEVGAAVTQDALLSFVKERDDFPLLRQAMPWTGHYQTRQKGTVCGSLVHSDPSSELPLCLKMLQGEIVIQSKRKKRIVSADAFQLGLLETDVRPGELVTAVRFPKSKPDARFGFHEVSQRHGDFAMVAIAVEARDGAARIGVAGVADVPTVKEIRVNGGGGLADALNEFAWALGGADDVHATGRYRRHLVRTLGQSMIEDATA